MNWRTLLTACLCVWLLVFAPPTRAWPICAPCGYECEIRTEPRLLLPGELVGIWAGGVWPDACAPQFHAAQVIGSAISLQFLTPYPPDGGCAAVLTGWGHSEAVGDLAPGLYTLSLYVDRCICTQIVIVVPVQVTHLPLLHR